MLLNECVMKSDVLVVTKIKKKSSAKFFKDLKVGDLIYLSCDLSSNRPSCNINAKIFKIHKIEFLQPTNDILVLDSTDLSFSNGIILNIIKNIEVRKGDYYVKN